MKVEFDNEQEFMAFLVLQYLEDTLSRRLRAVKKASEAPSIASQAAKNRDLRALQALKKLSVKGFRVTANKPANRTQANAQAAKNNALRAAKTAQAKLSAQKAVSKPAKRAQANAQAAKKAPKTGIAAAKKPVKTGIAVK